VFPFIDKEGGPAQDWTMECFPFMDKEEWGAAYSWIMECLPYFLYR
jgi:hypothetical protein